MRKATMSPRAGAIVALGAVLACLAGTSQASARIATVADTASAAPTATPIQHVIVIVGENHTFDNIYATYKAPAGPDHQGPAVRGHRQGQRRPGPERGLARQWTATDTTGGILRPTPIPVAPYSTLPPPNTTYVDPRCDGGLAP